MTDTKHCVSAFRPTLASFQWFDFEAIKYRLK